jgi:hypothetical protein
MTILDEIAREKQQISQRLTLIDAELAKLNEHRGELEIAERALNRFGRITATTGMQTARHPTSTAARANAKHRARSGQQDKKLTMSDAV